MELGGIVVAGGSGRRFGEPKAAAQLGGQTLVERAVGDLRARCVDVVVVSRPGVLLPPMDVTVVHDDPGPDAPIVGLATGLRHLTTQNCLVLACDIPFAAPILDRLCSHPLGHAVVASDRSGRAQPLLARYPRAEALTAATRRIASGELTLQALVTELGATLIVGSDDELLNINTPDDLARAEALLAQAGSTSTTAL